MHYWSLEYKMRYELRGYNNYSFVFRKENRNQTRRGLESCTSDGVKRLQVKTFGSSVKTTQSHDQ